MSKHTPNPETESRDEGKLGNRRSAEQIFHTVESQDGAGTERAHVIAIWTGLFIFAIVVSQFGRPSRAREADFLRASAKVAALGKTEHNTSVGRQIAISRMEDAKELTPAIYASRKYGVAWQYPRTYVLRKGAKANLDLYGQPATESAFTATGNDATGNEVTGNAATGDAPSGTVALATVIIPAREYAGTDFKAASLTARVNARISENDCGQFRRASSDTGDDVALSASQETVGTIDFATAEVDAADLKGNETGASGIDGNGTSGSEVTARETVPAKRDTAKASGGAPGISAREKFYHVYENGACYEFAMRVSTGASTNAPSASRVDKDDVFDRLAEILTSVTIVPVRSAAAPTEAHGN